MPEISRFLGIVVSILYRDHEPPHFHATYGEFEITVGILEATIKGKFPRRALAHILEWRELHTAELLENWKRARAREALAPIRPLE
jgi:hypothetical protein